jgi:hypothetical protein
MVGMPVQLSVIGIVVSDMGRSLAFYRRLGLDAPAGSDGEPHVEVELAGGLKVAFDTEDTVRSFDPTWARPADGHGIALAFACDDRAAVDSKVKELVAAG